MILWNKQNKGLTSQLIQLPVFSITLRQSDTINIFIIIPIYPFLYKCNKVSLAHRRNMEFTHESDLSVKKRRITNLL